MHNAYLKRKFIFRAVLMCGLGDTPGIAHLFGLVAPGGYGSCRFCTSKAKYDHDQTKKIVYPDIPDRNNSGRNWEHFKRDAQVDLSVNQNFIFCVYVLHI